MELEENKYSENYKKEAYLRAQKKLKEIKGFYWHAFWYAVVNIFLIVLMVTKSDNWHIETFYTPLFWGIGLGFHALGVFGKNWFFGKKWEQRKIKEFMDKDKQKWT